MIIKCNNCNKIFDINENLIPKTGRLVQCNNCNNKWFFKNETNAQLKPFDSINSIE